MDILTSRHEGRRHAFGGVNVLEAPGLFVADVLPQVVEFDALFGGLGLDVSADPAKVLLVFDQPLVEEVYLLLAPVPAPSCSVVLGPGFGAPVRRGDLASPFLML